jgi:hypothetical protein
MDRQERIAVADQEERQIFQENQNRNLAEEFNSISTGLTPSEAMEKLFKMEINEKENATAFRKIMSRLNRENSPFSIIKPSRDFVLGNHDLFDEFEIIGDFEDALMLTQLDPAFWGTALLLYEMAITRSAITRSRAGFQQKNLRSYYSFNQRNSRFDDEPKRWAIPFMGGKRSGDNG